MMETATKILITGGVVAITVSLLLGVDLARRRQSQPITDVSGWLTAHQTVLFQGFLMFGMSLASVMSPLGSGWETTAAWLIVAGATFSTIANVSNAKRKVTDQFAQRSLGLRLNTMQSVVLTPGVIILLVGVLRAL